MIESVGFYQRSRFLPTPIPFKFLHHQVKFLFCFSFEAELQRRRLAHKFGRRAGLDFSHNNRDRLLMHRAFQSRSQQRLDNLDAWTLHAAPKEANGLDMEDEPVSDDFQLISSSDESDAPMHDVVLATP